ncbi:hypothetical protein [Streptomyces uncialis]|uniref:hypothetical protein n=1 Tax=Streptomyces uncialis TaxID=1048205 RepID=UPI0022592DEA|nr:hypothetical protein [Streptomyces uncialis]MCX4659165.1 hypothetical protein [Streptomyces uncialis]
MPTRHAPRVLNAVGATVDAGLVQHGRPEDYEGEAAQWLDSQTAHALGLGAKFPVPGHEDDSTPPLYTRELAAGWLGPEHAIVELSGPGLDDVCSLWIHGLTDTAARAVIAACVQSITVAPPAAPSASRSLHQAKARRR